MLKENPLSVPPPRPASFLPFLTIAAAVLLAIVFSFQYYWQTTFPIGGDAADYVATAKQSLRTMPHDLKFAWSNITATAYPLAHVLFIFSALIPIPWPDRFTLWTTLAHLLTSLSLGVLLYRLSGWRSAAGAIIIWALATTTINNHFEDGTLAQLMSLPLLIWFFIHFFSGRKYLALIFLILTFLTHPITGLMAITTIAASVPPLLVLTNLFRPPHRSAVIIFSLISGLLILAGSFAIFSKLKNFQSISPDLNPFSLIEITRSFFGPFVLLAPLGLLIITRWLNTRPLAAITLINFSLISLLTSQNHLLGLSLWTFRFQTYLIMAITILSALALPRLIRLMFSYRPLRLAFILIFFAAISLTAWDVHANIYQLYESPARYHRLHPDELAALEWINSNLNNQFLIISSNATRHAEWIYPLTDHPWKATSSADQYFSDLLDDPPPLNTRYFMVFKKVEKLNIDLSSYSHARRIFSNDAADIYIIQANVKNSN